MRKNYSILRAIAEKRITQAEVTRQAKLSSEARLSRMIHYLIKPTQEEIKRIASVLEIPESEVCRDLAAQGEEVVAEIRKGLGLI